MSESDNDDEPVVNFRLVLPGIHSNLYRSSAPEWAANKIRRDDDDDNNHNHNNNSNDDNEDPELTCAERFILTEVDMIVDLRSSREGDLALKQKLIEESPGGVFETYDNETPETYESGKRYWMEVNLIGKKSEILDFIDNNWLEPNELKGLEDSAVLIRRRSSLSSRGLAGLNQMLLERKQHMCDVLKLITQYLEILPDAKVLVNCTAGKDRTGMVCMLLQSVAGFSDEDIITEYTISEAEAKHIMARALKRHSNPLFDPAIMSGATVEGIQGALTHMRSTYGSVDQYLDNIGFDGTWRNRLRKVLVGT